MNHFPLFPACKCLLKKAAPDMLCAFLCNQESLKFATIRVEHDGMQLTLKEMNYIPAPEFHFIEFDVDPERIYGLYCNSLGEFNVTICLLNPEKGYNWSSRLEISPVHKIEARTDPEKIYCYHIFGSGLFRTEDIQQALVVSFE